MWSVDETAPVEVARTRDRTDRGGAAHGAGGRVTANGAQLGPAAAPLPRSALSVSLRPLEYLVEVP